jgi:hypothetical protein
MAGFRRVALAAALWCGTATAAPPDILHYTVRLHGIALLGATFCFQLNATGYEAGIEARTLGLADFLFHGSSHINVSGTVDGSSAVQPHDYTEHSRLSGEDYSGVIDFASGTPVLREQTPAQNKYRLPIPASALPHAIDGLSAVAVQSLAAAAGRCPGDTRLYDGRQVRLISMHDGAPDTLAHNARSVFAGQALRCETDSTMLAGFLKSSSVQSQSKTHHGKLWLAAIRAGGPAIPVRMVFDADMFGDIVIQLDAASPAPSQGCSTNAWTPKPP